MREYVVLRSNGSPAWEFVGRVSSGSASAALRKAMNLSEGKAFGAHDCVVVPARYWQPQTVEFKKILFTHQSVVDLYLSARSALTKLKTEYRAGDPEAPEDECWAEGEKLDEALRRMDGQLLADLLGAK